jgi:tetratricopeptide (TPR) repeat protein
VRCSRPHAAAGVGIQGATSPRATAEAFQAAAGLAALNPRTQTLDNLGVVFTRAGLHERAAPYYERATAVQGTPGRFYNLGAALQFLGRFEDARAAYRKCIAMAPHHGQAWSSLTQITRATRETNDIPASRLPAARSAHGRMPQSGHALAKSFETLAIPRGVAWLDRARQAESAAVSRRSTMTVPSGVRSADLPPATAMRARRSSLSACRARATLVDRILSSHSW